MRFLFLLLFIPAIAVAQVQNPSFTVSGFVFIQNEADSANALRGGTPPNREEMARRREGGEGARGGFRMPMPLDGANVALYNAVDSSLVTGAIADQSGRFTLNRIRNGAYYLVSSYIGYEPYITPVLVQGENINRVLIPMREDPMQLGEIEISALIPRVEVRGDTTAFNADGYQVNPDANAEDLVRRMPGFTMENGRIQAQGEEVRRVLVDGEEFFGEDATVALRNLPAEIISQIEVFDRQSDQARFTGFNDGNTDRTINIVTRPGMNTGQFGRSGLSFGTDNRYMGSGNLNSFNGSRRISILGMSNNINQQNFSGDDLSGVAASTQNQGGRGGMGGGRWGGRGDVGNFLTGSNSGINTTHSFGVNYIDRPNPKTRINASYFYNGGDNTTVTSVNRSYNSEFQADQRYTESVNSTADNYNHRFTGRVEYNFNPRTSVIITPNVRLQQRSNADYQLGETFVPSEGMLNSINNIASNDDLSYTIANNALFRQRFEKRGRTLSVNLRTNVNAQTGEQLQNTESIFFENDPNVNDRTQITDQNTEINSGGYSISTDIQYTEPLNEKSQLQLSYNPGFDVSRSVRNAFEFDQDFKTYSMLSAELTNRFRNETITQRIGSGYRYNDQKYGFNVNLNYQFTSLNGSQTFPIEVSTNKQYHNFLPSANLRYNLSQRSNINFNYRTSLRTPSASQLQDVIDNTNPLQLSSGNPDLDQQYSHNWSVRSRLANVDAGTSLFGFLSLTLTQNFIGNNTFIAVTDTQIRDSIILGRGGRYTRPENIGDSWNIRSFVNYSMPFKAIKSNINFNGGATYAVQPTLNNGIKSEARNTGLNSGTSLSSNIGPNVDFNISYRANYNIVDNTSNLGIDNNYYTGNANFRFNLLPWGKLLLASDLSLTHYEGLSEDFEKSVIYWNASVGFKFLEQNAAEIKLTVFDILGQNNSINRMVDDTFVQDVRSNVITRFAFVTFSYNFRSFRTSSSTGGKTLS